MSIAWGTALDAEVAYRHQQVRNDYHRRWTWRRRPAQAVSAQAVSAQRIPASVGTTHHRPAHHIPAQRVPAPLLPVRPVDQERTSAHAA